MRSDACCGGGWTHGRVVEANRTNQIGASLGYSSIRNSESYAEHCSVAAKVCTSSVVCRVVFLVYILQLECESVRSK